MIGSFLKVASLVVRSRVATRRALRARTHAGCVRHRSAGIRLAERALAAYLGSSLEDPRVVASLEERVTLLRAALAFVVVEHSQKRRGGLRVIS